MRKKFLYVTGMLAFGTAVMFTSCSNDDEVINGDNVNVEEDAVQQIILQVANSGDGLTTRAGRPLESSEAAQDIYAVKLLICDEEDNIVYTTKLTDWMGTAATNYTNGRETTIKLTEENKLAAGNYKVYAIGYGDGTNKNENSDYSNLASITGLDEDDTFNENTVLTLTDGKIGEEIFAGSLSLTVTEGQGFKTQVVLNRQVAGVFGYMDDIPYMEGVSKLQLVAANKSNSLVLGNFANDDHNSADIASPNYVVNSVALKSATTQVIYTINLSDWFTEIKDDDNDGIIDRDGNWISAGHTSYANGSVFGSSFIIPFLRTSAATFELRLTKEDGSILRTWTVKLGSGDDQIGQSITVWNGSTFTMFEGTDNNNSYSVVRNHLYGIGVRTDADTENPGEDPNVDYPKPLYAEEDLGLRANENWEVIHEGMEVE